MAVGGPLVISSNAATLKWRPFSSCFNLSQLLQRYIRLLPISDLSARKYPRLAAAELACAHGFTSFPFPRVRTHAARLFSENTCVEKQRTAETLGGNDVHCLFNHVLWDDSVIMLSSARFSAAKTGPPKPASLPAHNSTLQVLTVKRKKASFFFHPSSLSSLFIHFYYKHSSTEGATVAFWSSHIKPVWQALCVNSQCKWVVGQQTNTPYVLYWTDETESNSVSY